jgi:hypothetical protein
MKWIRTVVDVQVIEQLFNVQADMGSIQPTTFLVQFCTDSRCDEVHIYKYVQSDFERMKAGRTWRVSNRNSSSISDRFHMRAASSYSLQA